MRRTLRLKKETLVELTTGELGSVAGAAATPACPTLHVDCRVPTDHCQTVDLGCVSLLMNPCLTEPTIAC